MNTKNNYLSVRLTKREKTIIEKKANTLGIKTSDYVRNVCLDTKNTKGEKIIMLKLVYAAVALQELYNYVEENYKEDKFIKGVTEELWNSLL